MPDPIKMMGEHPAKAIALFAVAMCVGFGTCGFAALSMHGNSNTLLSGVALAGAALCAVSAVGLVVMLIVVLVRLIRKVYER